MDLHFWKNWSIRTRLIAITIVPVLYMFSTFVWYSYQSRLNEVRDELAERGRLVATVLAEGGEFNLVAGKYDELKRTIDGLVLSDPSIYRIEILDTLRRDLVQAAARSKGVPDQRHYEAPIMKRLSWVSVLASDGTPYVSGGPAGQRSGLKVETVGWVRVTMTPTAQIDKHMRRFGIELLVSSLGLLVCAVLAFHLSKGLTASLESSMAALRDIRGGNYLVEVAVTTGGEIGDLQASIREMAASLHQATQNLEHKIAERTADLLASRNEALKADADKRKLIQKVNTIVEDERKSIALEIHDELNASLIAARLESQRILALAGKADLDPAALDEIKLKAQSIIKLTLGLYNSGRTLVRRLRPEVLDMLGLHGAVEEMTALYDRGHPACRFSYGATGDFARLENGLAISAYRIIQEALSNVVKHAGATRVAVRLALDAQALRITVEDDGVGFDPAVAVAGIGIIGMRERVYAANGSIALDSGAAGTRIEIALPLA